MAETPFQITGVASGIGWDEIIAKTLEQARKPETIWQSKIDTLEYKRSLYQELSSAFFKLRSTLTTLRLESTYKAKLAEYTVRQSAYGGVTGVSDGSQIVKATVNASANIGSYDIDVEQLAETQKFISGKQDTAAALNIAGTFRIHVGNQVASITVVATDKLTDINKKIAQATDQNGNTLLATASVVDGRLVIESTLSGLDNTGTIATFGMTMSDSMKDASNNIITYLPRTKSGTYPEDLYSLSTSGITYIYGYDYEYNSTEGKITWLNTPTSPAAVAASFTPRHPANGDSIEIIVQYSTDVRLDHSELPTITGTRSDGAPYETLPITAGAMPLPSTAGAVVNILDSVGNLYSGAIITGAPPTLSDFNTEDFLVYNNQVYWRTEIDSSYLNAPAYTDTYNVVTLDGDSLPTLPSGAKFTSDCTFLITDVNGVTYTGELSSGLTGFSGAGNTNDFIIYDAGTAYAHDYRIIWNPNNTQPADNDAFAVSIRSPGNYEYSQNSVFLEEDGAATNANSVLVKLGFMAETPPNSGVYAIDTTLVKEAQDAKFTFNGVPITRSSNTINADSEEGALIENVSLELMSEGRVVINITQNAAAAVEAMESFVEAYNEVMTWIDEKLAEKYNSNTVDAEDDYLQSILSEANGSTVFGALHGDQLLWSIKNQLRSMVSNTISTLSTTIRTRKVSFPAEPMNMEGSFYVNSGGKVARIDILSTDSMEDIQRKLRFATNINNGANGAAPAGADMDLEVVLENGQLVIKRPSATAGTATMQDSLTRGSGSSEYLSYVPDTSKPVNGLLTVYSGSATNTATYVEYVQGTDYRISTLENADGVLESKIEWITGGKAPAANSTYSVSYAYDPSAVSFTAIPTTNSSSLYELDFLDLHYDSGRVQLSSYGLATESIDFGKSGLLEFDSDAFFQAIVDDSSIVSKVMTTFMKTFDSYIGNLVDSSQIQVGGAVITKGRIAAALSNIDTEVSSLQSQIDKLETQLALRQTTLYKQYTNMELAIQKLNAQMSSLTQFLTYANSSTSTS